MNQRSKFNEKENQDALIRLLQDLNASVENGVELVVLTRRCLKDYVAAGYSTDDDIVSDLVGIDSETDSMDVGLNNTNADFDRVFNLYSKPFEQVRQNLLVKVSQLGDLGNI